MRGIRVCYCLIAVLLLWAPQARAQEPRVVGTDELEATVARRAAAVEHEREQLRALLQRDEVRAVAESHGIGLERIERGIGTLGSAELERIAPHAAAVEAALQDGVRIGTTAIIVILLLVVLIILIT
jgi:hypothetical protein